MRSLFKPFGVLGLILATGIGLLVAQSGSPNQVKQTPPIQLGTSGGNVNNISRAFCCSGTLGSLVTKGNVDYILSNNHILADTDTATVGDPISQPGLVDVGCNANNAQIVANFSQAVQLGTGNVDAALAQIVNGEVNTKGKILEIGIPASTPAPIDSSALGRGVAKSGRTTGLTCATIGSIDTNVRVQYQKGCNSGRKFSVTFSHQVLVNGSSFSAGGDSGSLIVTSDTAQPIALLFAGSSTTTIGNRISDVMDDLAVTFVGGKTHDIPACMTAADLAGKTQRAILPAALARATGVKDRHAHSLMADPAVIGVGVGASQMNPSEAVVVIYLEQGRAHGAIPSQLDGVRTDVIRTDAFRAYGWNEAQRKSCSVK